MSGISSVLRKQSSCHRPCNAGITVPIHTLKLNSFVPGQFIEGECFVTPGAAGMGMDIDSAKRHYVVH